jgi:hypothetical protein
MILLNHVVEVFHSPEFTISRQDFLRYRRDERLWVGGMLVRPDGKRQTPNGRRRWSVIINFLKKRWAAETLRLAESMNSIVYPAESTVWQRLPLSGVKGFSGSFMFPSKH